MNIDNIIQEWFYRLPNGYATEPYSKQELAILSEVLTEQKIDKNNCSLFEGVKKAKPGPIVNAWKDAQAFESFIKVYVYGNQEVKGLSSLYSNLSTLPTKMQEKCVAVLQNTKVNKSMLSSFSISGVNKVLFDEIMRVVKVTGGDTSEFWYAIVTGGKVKGGTAGDTGITSDVDVGNKAVSLKNYSSNFSVDFGKLGDLEGHIFTLKNILEMVTDVEINVSIGRTKFNDALRIFEAPQTINNLTALFELDGKGITIVQRLIDQLKKYMKKPGDVSTIITKIMTTINDIVQAKINTVDYWVVIVGGSKVIAHSSAQVAKGLEITGNQLPMSISNFKGGNLFVSGTALQKAIEGKKAQ